MKATVLVVDDEEPNRATLTRILEREGHRVVSASEGREALATLKVEAPHVLLTDLKMPGMDGMELLQSARQVDGDLEVILIRKSATESRATLHDDGVLAAGQFKHASRRHAHPTLGGFDFGGDSNGHGSKQIPEARMALSPSRFYSHNILTISNMCTWYTIFFGQEKTRTKQSGSLRRRRDSNPRYP